MHGDFNMFLVVICAADIQNEMYKTRVLAGYFHVSRRYDFENENRADKVPIYV